MLSLTRAGLLALSPAAAALQLSLRAAAVSALPPRVCAQKGARLAEALRTLAAEGAAVWPDVRTEGEALLSSLAVTRTPLPPPRARALAALQYDCLGLAALAGAAPLTQLDVSACVEAAAADVRELCVSKFGVAPRVEVMHMAGVGVRALASHSFLHFALVELLKNASSAVLDHFTPLRVEDDAPPVTAHVGARGGRAVIALADAGGGLPGGSRTLTHGDFAFFLSSAPPPREPNYTYSGDFGAAFRGSGTGLIRASLIARWHGGSLALLSQASYGVTAALELEVSGVVGDIFDVAYESAARRQAS